MFNINNVISPFSQKHLKIKITSTKLIGAETRLHEFDVQMTVHRDIFL